MNFLSKWIVLAITIKQRIMLTIYANHSYNLILAFNKLKLIIQTTLQLASVVCSVYDLPNTSLNWYNPALDGPKAGLDWNLSKYYPNSCQHHFKDQTHFGSQPIQCVPVISEFCLQNLGKLWKNSKVKIITYQHGHKWNTSLIITPPFSLPIIKKNFTPIRYDDW